MSQHVLSVKVENQSGVLARVVGLFSARGYNIDSLTVNKTQHGDMSVITLVVRGDDRVIEQVKKQLNKLIDVIKVSDHSETPSIQRELTIIKLNTVPSCAPLYSSASATGIVPKMSAYIGTPISVASTTPNGLWLPSTISTHASGIQLWITAPIPTPTKIYKNTFFSVSFTCSAA